MYKPVEVDSVPGNRFFRKISLNVNDGYVQNCLFLLLLGGRDLSIKFVALYFVCVQCEAFPPE